MLALLQGRTGRLTSRITPFLVFASVVTIVIAWLVLYPLIRMLIRVFLPEGRLDLSGFALLTSPDVGQMLLNTAIALGCSMVAAAIIGSAFAWLNERTDARMGVVTDVLPIVPLMVPPVAGAVGWVFLASPGAGLLNVGIRSLLEPLGVTLRQGPINIHSWPGLIFVYTLYLVPIVYLVVSASLRRLDSSFEEASRVSGASAFSTFRRITLPAIAPSVASAAVLALVFGLALFSVPVVVATRARIDILAVAIIDLVRTFPADINGAMVLGSVMLLVVGIAWLIQLGLRRAGHFATVGGRASQGSRVRLGSVRTPARVVMILYLAATSVLPFLALLLVSTQSFWSPVINWSELSLSNYGDVLFRNEQTASAIRNSGILALVGSTLAVFVAVTVAFFVVRSGFAGQVADGLVKLPGAVSRIIMGVAFLVAFAGPPFRLGGTLTILLLAFITVNMPQASLTAGTALEQVGRDLWEASFVAGAGEGTTFRKVLVPLALPGLMAGWAMVFVLIAGDLTISSMLASSGTRVVGFVLLDLWQFGGYPRVATLAVGISVLSLTVVGSALLLARGRGGPRLLAGSSTTGSVQQ